jgi:hypothetical protein
VSERERIIDDCHSMKVGQAITFDRRVIADAFGRNSIFSDRPAIDGLLENLMGSNYGAFLATVDPLSGNVTISRHEPGDERGREDWDRR